MSKAVTTSHMYKEAAYAAEGLRESGAAARRAAVAAAERLRDFQPDFIATCARGSSDHAATYAKYLIETRARTPTFSHAPSISSVFETTSPHFRRAALLAISQSGHSPDLLLSVEAAKRVGSLILVMVNDASSPLAKLADVLLPLQMGPEVSIAATKSFIATLAQTLNLVAEWTDADDLRMAFEGLPNDLANAWGMDWSAAVEPLSQVSSLFVLGRGLTLSIAQEAALKFKETSGIHAEAFSTAEVVHGPAALITKGFPVLVFPPVDAASLGVREQVEAFQQRGALTIVVGEGFGGDIVLPLGAGLRPAVAPIAMVQSFYGLVNAVAFARGHDPDRPPFLKKVTHTR